MVLARQHSGPITSLHQPPKNEGYVKHRGPSYLSSKSAEGQAEETKELVDSQEADAANRQSLTAIATKQDNTAVSNSEKPQQVEDLTHVSKPIDGTKMTVKSRPMSSGMQYRHPTRPNLNTSLSAS